MMWQARVKGLELELEEKEGEVVGAREEIVRLEKKNDELTKMNSTLIA